MKRLFFFFSMISILQPSHKRRPRLAVELYTLCTYDGIEPLCAEHSAQKIFPQARQWCFLFNMVNGPSHLEHVSVSSSGAQFGGKDGFIETIYKLTMRYIYMKLKAILLGDTGVGKSTLLSFIRENQNATPTIGVDCVAYKSLQLWDTSGHERFKTIIPTFYSDMRMVIFVYKDLDSFAYLENIRRSVCRLNRDKHLKWILVYNGTDESIRLQGDVYCVMYNMAFLSGDFSVKKVCKCIVDNIERYTDNEQKNGWKVEERCWRYCWFY
jgi:small GTP-binding protein